jgi:surface antigen
MACLTLAAPPALAGTGGYPYANMPCELAPYNTVGYCNTVSGPYDWGPVKNGSPASQLSPYRYGYRNCTDYVAWKIHQVLGVTLPTTLGNAATWGPRLKKAGYHYDSTPRPGDIAAWNTGAGGFGHVAYVYAVKNGVASLDEYNVAGTGAFSSNRTTASSSAGAPSEYVHIGALPTGSATGRNIFYTGANGQINQWWVFNGAWQNVALSGEAAAAGTSPSAMEASTGRNIFYVGADNAIWQWAVVNGAWHNYRLGGTVAAGTSPSTVEDSSTGANIFYVGANGQINQWWVFNGAWQNVALSGEAAAAQTSPSTVEDSSTGRNIFYVGANGQINQWWVYNGAWQNVALSGEAADAGTSPSAVEDSGTG